MPDWAYNELTIAGDSKTLSILKSKLKNEKEETDFDFNYIKPMPEDFKVEYDSNSDIGLLCYCKKNNIATNSLYKSHLHTLGHYTDTIYTNINNDKITALGEHLYNNILKYGSRDWYDWRRRHWGTKWNASEVQCYDDNITSGKLSYYFDTAWSSPLPVIAQLSYNYPDLMITLEVTYEGGDIPDVFIIKGGEMIDHLEKCDKVFIFDDGTEISEDDDNINDILEEKNYDFEEHYKSTRPAESIDLSIYIER